MPEVKPFRCRNPECPVGGNFDAELPVCPHCAADGRVNRGAVVELPVCHYLARDQAGPLKCRTSNWKVACMPARTRLPPHATGARPSVTCPKCRASLVFKEHEAGGVDQHVPVIEGRIKAETGVTVAQD